MTSALDQGAFARHIASDSRLLAEAARKDLGAPVPACPEWSMRQLVQHLGGVQRFWTNIATRGLMDPREGRADLLDESDPGLLEWFEAGARECAEAAATIDVDKPMWTWSHVKTAAWLPRRMAQETVVHRWDAQDALGDADPIDAELACDGIDEILHVFLPASDSPKKGSGETVHLHTTDASGEWVVTLNDGDFSVTRKHAKGDVALRGPAADLLLVLWGRLPLTAVESHGDDAVFAALMAALDRE